MEIFTLLPTKMFSHDKINEYQIDYEKYLLEILQFSRYFRTNGYHFIRIVDQSHGEADAVANNYYLDFKLLAPTQFMVSKTKSLHNVDYSTMNKGFISVKSKTNGISQEASNQIFIEYMKLFASLSSEEIIQESNKENSPIFNTIKLFKIKKNLMFFLPCLINVPNDNDDKQTEQYLRLIVSKFFKSLFSIRDNMGYDTYIVFLTNKKQFYIMEYEDAQFKTRDFIPQEFISSFNEIYLYTYFTENH